MNKILSPQTVIWMLGIVAAAAVAMYRIDLVEKNFTEFKAEACTTFVRQDVLMEQMKRIEEKLDRIEAKLDQRER